MLDDGFVTLVDVMGDDTSVVEAARVSYGAGTRRCRTIVDEVRLSGTSAPLTRMAEIKLLVRVRDTWRQWIRHRSASVNEYSTRYSLAII